jgi:hypothetical protein
MSFGLAVSVVGSHGSTDFVSSRHFRVRVLDASEVMHARADVEVF